MVIAAAAEGKTQPAFLPEFSNHPATNIDSHFLSKFIGPAGIDVSGYKVPHLQAEAQFGYSSGVQHISGLTHSC